MEEPREVKFVNILTVNVPSPITQRIFTSSMVARVIEQIKERVESRTLVPVVDGFPGIRCEIDLSLVRGFVTDAFLVGDDLNLGIIEAASQDLGQLSLFPESRYNYHLTGTGTLNGALIADDYRLICVSRVQR